MVSVVFFDIHSVCWRSGVSGLRPIRLFQESCAARRQSHGRIFVDLEEAFHRVARELVHGGQVHPAHVESLVRTLGLDSAVVPALSAFVTEHSLVRKAGGSDWAAQVFKEFSEDSWFTHGPGESTAGWSGVEEGPRRDLQRTGPLPSVAISGVATGQAPGCPYIKACWGDHPGGRRTGQGGQTRIGSAWCAFRECKKQVFMSLIVSHKEKSTLFTSLVESTLYYGVGAWPGCDKAVVSKFQGALAAMARLMLQPAFSLEQARSLGSEYALAVARILPAGDAVHIERLRHLRVALDKANPELWALLHHMKVRGSGTYRSLWTGCGNSSGKEGVMLGVLARGRMSLHCRRNVLRCGEGP